MEHGGTEGLEKIELIFWKFKNGNICPFVLIAKQHCDRVRIP